MRPLLRFDTVSLRRGGKLLFEGLDLTLGPGEALMVTGPNGSGKSSLIRLAAGLLAAERGTVERTRLALADDRPAFDRELALERALSFWGGRTGHALGLLGLGGLAEVPVRLLSAGQAKRASLARVAASGAPLWLLDEPANGLDSRSLELLAALVARHRETGGAVLAASHSTLPGDWRELALGGGGPE